MLLKADIKKKGKMNRNNFRAPQAKVNLKFNITCSRTSYYDDELLWRKESHIHTSANSADRLVRLELLSTSKMSVGQAAVGYGKSLIGQKWLYIWLIINGIFWYHQVAKNILYFFISDQISNQRLPIFDPGLFHRYLGSHNNNYNPNWEIE